MMCGSKGCGGSKAAWWLLIIGGLNWGIDGLGYFLGKGWDWNVVHMILGQWMWLEGLVYLLVGISALLLLWGCKCKSCSADAK